MMDKKRAKRSILGRIILLSVTLCLVDISVAGQKNNKDPYEGYNRIAFRFNDTLDTYVLKPVAQGYNTIMPYPLREGVSNFYRNIDTVPVILNDILQGNFYQATSDSWRLLINTTVGVLGIFDVASHIGLDPNTEEDLGLTFAQWGWKNSNYFVLPFFGPSTVRDTLAKPIEYQFMTIYPWVTSMEDVWLLYGGGVINQRAQLLKLEAVMKQAAIDKYVFQRNAYLQHRAYLIQRNHELDDPYLLDDEEDFHAYDDFDADEPAPTNNGKKATTITPATKTKASFTETPKHGTIAAENKESQKS